MMLHPEFYTPYGLYIYVYNRRTEFNLSTLHQYLHTVASKCPDAKILIVGTCSDLASGCSTPPLLALKATYPQVSVSGPVRIRNRAPCMGS
jgi:hypothetical protein